MSRTHSLDFSMEGFDDATNKLICELHLEASEVCTKITNIHTYIAILKTKVSPKDFLTIVSSVGLPLTTISIMDPAKQESNVDTLLVRDHMPDPNILYGNEATKLLGALVRYYMQNLLLTTQWVYPMAACENDFNLGHTKFERVVSGIKRAGGHEYRKKRKVCADELPTGAVKPKKKKQNPVDKGQAGSVKTGIACKYCDKVCLSDETLSIHVNNGHADKQPVFQCAFCGIKINEFRLYIKHLEEHSKDMYKCYKCGKQFDNARLLRKHVATHINQCPLCSRTFESLLVLANHVNNSHGKALKEDLKKCQYSDAAFDTFDELSTHCKGHRSYFCDICYARFISEPLLVEHRVNDHPEGCPAEISERTPTPRAETPEITITKIVDPEMDNAMEVVCTPDPNPFADKWHLALGQTHKDSKHKIECEVCHRYLKSSDLRVEHVKHFHPTVLYDCGFCPGEVLYTLQDLLKHCMDLHFVCQQCNSAHKDKDALKEHMASEHQPAPQPAQATAASTASDTNVCPARPKPGFVCGIYCQTEASFRIYAYYS